MIPGIIIGVLLLAGLVVYLVKRHAENSPVVLLPLSNGPRRAPAIFCPWMERDEAVIAKHGLYIDVAEAYGAEWVSGGSPSLIGALKPGTLSAAVAKRGRLKALNPDIKLFLDIGYTESVPSAANFPLGHPWWLRDAAGNLVPGWIGGDPRPYLFDLGNPAVRQHCAESCAAAIATGIWDGIFLDVFVDDERHVDILRRIRILLPYAALLVNCNYRICSNVAPLVNGIFMECGPLTAAQWPAVQAALDFNERHVRQPAMNCLEISGARDDERSMRAATCLALTRSNAYVVYADPGPGYASTHRHAWYPFWDLQLGRPTGSTMAAGQSGSQRTYEHGRAVYMPLPGYSFIELT